MGNRRHGGNHEVNDVKLIAVRMLERCAISIIIEPIMVMIAEALKSVRAVPSMVVMHMLAAEAHGRCDRVPHWNHDEIQSQEKNHQLAHTVTIAGSCNPRKQSGPLQMATGVSVRAEVA